MPLWRRHRPIRLRRSYLRIRRGQAYQFDVGTLAAVILDARERGIDDTDSLLYLLATILQVRLKRSHTVDRLLVEE